MSEIESKHKTGRANINFYNRDNIAFMRSKPDNYYKLAIVDPEYGIGINNNIGRRKGDKHSGHKKVKWDSKPPAEEYFKELYRISENQIIWGANYFNMPPCKGFIIWDKLFSNDVSFSACEYAYTSFDITSKIFKHSPQQNQNKIHPTQKSVKLYKWLLTNYAKEGDNILDTHGGSASIALACWDLGFDLDLCELDKEYFNDSWNRFNIHAAQQQLF